MKYVVFEPTPIDSVDYIKEIITDKVVYDLGCGDGRFAKAMQAYAKKVVGVEIDPVLAAESQANNVETVQQTFMSIDLKHADVIFVFLNFIGMYALTKKIQKDGWKGTLISHYYPLHNSLDDIVKPDKVIDVDLDVVNFPFLLYDLTTN